jgi:hypothetical protein
MPDSKHHRSSEVGLNGVEWIMIKHWDEPWELQWEETDCPESWI